MKLLTRFFQTAVLATVVFSMLITLSAPALAQNAARVYLQVAESTDTQVTLDVIAENVSDMYGAEVHLRYDPAVVSVQDTSQNQDGIQIEAGTLLPLDQGFVVANKVDENTGTIVFALTLLNPAPPVNGSGPLARITFNRLQNAPINITIERSKLVAVDLQTIPSQPEPLTIGGSEPAQVVPQQAEQAQQPVVQEQTVQQQNAEESVAAPAPANPTPVTENSPNFPWWIIAAAIMILGVVGLGALVMMSSFTKTEPSRRPQAQTRSTVRQQTPNQQPQPSQQPHRQRGQHVPGTRPSAFK